MGKSLLGHRIATWTNRPSIRSAAQLSIILIIAVITFLWSETNSAIKNTKIIAEQQSIFQFNTMRHLLSDALYFDDAEKIRKYVEVLDTQNLNTRSAIFTSSGELVFDSNQEKVPVGNIESAFYEIAVKHKDASSHWQNKELEIVGTIDFDDQIIGGIYIHKDYSKEFYAAEDALSILYLNGLLICILSAGFFFAYAANRGTTESLKVAQSNFRELLAQTPISTAIFQIDGKLKYMNPAFQNLMNWNTQDADFVDYNLIEDPYMQNVTIMSQIKEGFTQATNISRFEYTREIENKDNLWLEGIIFPLLNQYKEIEEVVLVFLNVTRVKQAEEERIVLHAQVLESQKLESLGIMAGGIAHDFNNLLLPILGNAELLQLDLAEDSDLQDHVTGILSASSRAAELCTQMLTYAGDGIAEKVSINLNDEINGLNELFRSSLDKKTKLTLKLSKDMPDFLASQGQINQIVMNLIFNASEALEGAEGQVTVETGCKSLGENEIDNLTLQENINPGDHIYLKVSDTGCGMNDSVLLNVFNPFFTTKFTGRGLGMSALLGIVKDHHGGIEIQTKVNEGSTFTIYLPKPNLKQISSESRVATSERKFTGHILLVDDEPLVRDAGERLLTKLGFKVSKAENGLEALALLKRKADFTIILLDLLMPELGGEETLIEIRKLDKKIPVLLMSGFSAAERTEKPSITTDAKVLQKPFSLAELSTAMSLIYPNNSSSI